MTARIAVQDVMKTPVYTIAEDKTGAEAIQAMRSHGIKKILVVSKDGAPIGVLEEWRVTKMDMEREIGKLDLSEPGFAPLGTQVSTIQQDLRDKPAVYIHDPKDKKKIVGVVTAYDFATLY